MSMGDMYNAGFNEEQARLYQQEPEQYRQYTTTDTGAWKQNSWESIDDYKEPFGKLITYILGSSEVSQDLKNEFINRSLRLPKFREWVKEYFPEYTSKIELWEKLNSGNRD